MSRFAPVYRFTVYAPRSVDPTEATVLTPRAGSVHADPFVVATRAGIAGAQPYLDAPTGRTGTIDALTKKRTIGAMTVRVGDVRTGGSGSNAVRWLTAFLGDASGGNQLHGRLARLEQSLDGGATWAPFFTGRIDRTKLAGRLVYELTLQDLGVDLTDDVYVSAPAQVAAVIAYASLPPAAPLGLLTPYADFPATQPLRGTVQTPTAKEIQGYPAGTVRIDVDRGYGDLARTIVTQAVLDLARRVAGRKTLATFTAQRPRAAIAAAGTGAYGAFHIALFPPFRNTSLTSVYVTPIAGGAAAPAAGTLCDFYLYDPTVGPTDRTPLLFNDVHPATLIKHLALGYFGRLDANGAAIRPLAIDASVTALEADASFALVRDRKVKSAKRNEEIEAVCRRAQLAYDITADGKLALIDLRRRATIAAAVALTDADLADPNTAPAWDYGRTGAVTALEATIYAEVQIPAEALPAPFQSTLKWPPIKGGSPVKTLEEFPDVPAVGVAEVGEIPVVVPFIGTRSGDYTPRSQKLDVTSFRYRAGDAHAAQQSTAADEQLGGQPRLVALEAELVRLAEELKGPYGQAPCTVDLVYARSSAAAAQVQPGMYVQLLHTALPDPATNQRGGARLGLVLSVTDDHLTRKVRCLDAGANAVAVPPVVGALVLNADGTVGVPITVNAAGEPVTVEVNVTTTAVGGRPADADANWRLWANGLTASGTVVLARLPAGARIWVRARSAPGGGTGYKLPSGWAYPSAPGYVDITVLPPPSAVAVTPGGDVADVTWTLGDAALEVEVLLVQGAAPAAWTDAMRVDPIEPAGTVQRQLVGLTPGTQYTVGVRHRDTHGGASAVAQATFVTTAARALAAPTRATVFGGGYRLFLGRPLLGGTYGLAVAAAEIPGTVEFSVAVETGIGTNVYGAFAVVGSVPSVPGDWTKWTGNAPRDRLKRQLRARHIDPSGLATPSAYTTPLAVNPWSVLPIQLGAFPSIDPATGLIRREIPLNDGKYMLQATDTGGTNAPTGVTDSTLLAIDRGLKKTLSGDPNDADGLPVGTNFRAVRKTALDGSGQVDLSQGGVINRTLANIGDGGGFSRVSNLAVGAGGYVDFSGAGWLNRHAGNLQRSSGDGTAVSTIVGQLTNAGHAAAAMQDSTALAINRGLKKSVSGDPNTADALALIPGASYRIPTLNEATGGGYAKTGLDASGFLLTGARATALIASRQASEVAKRVGAYFVETFEVPPSAASGWTTAGSVGGGTSADATMGNAIATATGFSQLTWSVPLAFNPKKLYRIRARVVNAAANTTGGSAFYVGVLQRDYAGNPTNANAGAGYVAANGYTPAVGTWVEYVGWFRGASQPFATTTLGVSTDAANPVALNAGTVTIQPYLLLGYSGSGGTFYVDYFLIDEFDEDAAARVYTGFDPSGYVKQALPAGIKQANGVGTVQVLAKGRLTGACANTDNVVFPANFFSTVPMVLIRPNMSSEPRAKWGATGSGAETGAFDATKPVYQDMAALGLGVSGFQMRARLMQKTGTPTARSHSFSATPLTTVGATAAVTTSFAPAYNDTYTAIFAASVTANDPGGSFQSNTVTLEVALDYFDTSWHELNTFTISARAVSGANKTVSNSNVSLSATVASILSTYQMRLRVKSITADGVGGYAVSVTPDKLTYSTATSQYASQTPDAGDVVVWEAIEVNSAS